MKKIFSFGVKMFSACLISFSLAAIFCSSLYGFVSVYLFGGLFLCLVFGLFND